MISPHQIKKLMFASSEEYDLLIYFQHVLKALLKNRKEKVQINILKILFKNLINHFN